MSDYTPTTEEVKACAESDNPYGELPDGLFDSWLTEHDRQVAVRAWDECRQFAYDIWADDALDQQIARANPYRAKGEQK